MFKKSQISDDKKPAAFKEKSGRLDPLDGKDDQIINQNYIKSHKQRFLKPTFFNPLDHENIDARRLKRAIFQFQGPQENNSDDQTDRKQAVPMSAFKETTLSQQRQFHQQNHEFLRMFSVISNSAKSQNKFKIKEIRESLNPSQNKGQNKAFKSSQNFSTVHLQLQTELTSSLISYKFQIKDIYSTMPFKRESIELEIRELLNPKYEFFVFQKDSVTIKEVRHALKDILQEGLTSEFKGNVIRTLRNIDFFQFLDLVSNRQLNHLSNAIEYPKQILQIAEQAEIFQLNSEEEEFYTKKVIQIKQNETNERLVACQEFDLQETVPSVYFQITEDYSLYKKHRELQFKKLKIYNKDISINTDIRNIISTEKIYLIELVKQIDLYIELTNHQVDSDIMKVINTQLRRKSEQFLKVLCNYTESKILKHYNIDNYHEKIMMFIEKSIKYNKQINNVNSQLLEEFPILKIWYQIPTVLFGYSRDSLQQKYYDLVRALLFYEQKIKNLDLERSLSLRRPGVKYPE